MVLIILALAALAAVFVVGTCTTMDQQVESEKVSTSACTTTRQAANRTMLMAMFFMLIKLRGC